MIMALARIGAVHFVSMDFINHEAFSEILLELKPKLLFVCGSPIIDGELKHSISELIADAL